MSSTYNKYGKYYDIIYKGKDYLKECRDLVEYLNSYSVIDVHKILDLACGTGGHSLAFASMGYDVVGIDKSPIMINKALNKAEKLNLKVEFLVQDMRKFSLRRIFDAAFCLFGSFGYLLEDKDVMEMLVRVREHLNRNALFIFDFWPSFRMSFLKRLGYTRSLRRIVGENSIILRSVNMDFNVENSIVEYFIECYVLNSAEKKVLDHFTEIHCIRCFMPSEIKHFLVEAGFEPLAFFDVNWGGEKIYTCIPAKISSSNIACLAFRR